MKKSCGFTLIELLIAASIFSIIILSIYSAFQTGILSYRKVDSAFETYQTARIALNRMELDLKNSFAYKIDDSKFQGNDTAIDFFTVLDSYEKDKPVINICRIKYEWAEDEKILKRTCYTGLDALKTDIQQEGVEVVSNIEKIIFEYAYPTGKEGEPSFEWQNSWPIKKDENDLTQQSTLPLAVKITLFVTEKGKPEEEKPIEFNKTISLPLGERVVSLAS